ncbi:hypothetical protein BDA99DRAFT_543388 [Phascolomyces articulosus]|uniref:Uncharacterized protein n=1 Tax=Phascolomyces articulosus TaxID=60185 RepID=A0AAD5JZ35_9FUNG|nr:hypothetical protein BDA99DRAFT_543388 [Phascolomyces articulosus]
MNGIFQMIKRYSGRVAFTVNLVTDFGGYRDAKRKQTYYCIHCGKYISIDHEPEDDHLERCIDKRLEPSMSTTSLNWGSSLFIPNTSSPNNTLHVDHTMEIEATDFAPSVGHNGEQNSSITNDSYVPDTSLYNYYDDQFLSSNTLEFDDEEIGGEMDVADEQVLMFFHNNLSTQLSTTSSTSSSNDNTNQIPYFNFNTINSAYLGEKHLQTSVELYVMFVEFGASRELFKHMVSCINNYIEGKLPPLLSYQNDDKDKNRNTGQVHASPFSSLPTFHSATFFPSDLMHMLAGIGKQIWHMISGDFGKEEGHLLYLAPCTCQEIGDLIVNSYTLSTNFSSNCGNIDTHSSFYRSIDWIHFTLYLLSSILLEYYSDQRTCDALILLAKIFKYICSHEICKDDIHDIKDAVGKWNNWLLDQVNNKRLPGSVFTINQHYLMHVYKLIECLGPMPHFAAFCIERAIDKHEILEHGRRLWKDRSVYGGNNLHCFVRIITEVNVDRSWSSRIKIEKQQYFGFIYGFFVHEYKGSQRCLLLSIIFFGYKIEDVNNFRTFFFQGVALVKSRNSTYSCPRCWLPTSQFHMNIIGTLHTEETVKILVERGYYFNSINEQFRCKRLSKDLSIHIIKNAFLEVPHFNIYDSLVVDELHQLGGVYSHLLKVIENMLSEAEQLEIDLWLVSMFNNTYMITTLVSPTYDELKQHIGILLACVHNKIPPQMVLCLRYFINFMYQVVAKEHSADTLDEIENNLQLFYKYSPQAALFSRMGTFITRCDALNDIAVVLSNISQDETAQSHSLEYVFIDTYIEKRFSTISLYLMPELDTPEIHIYKTITIHQTTDDDGETYDEVVRTVTEFKGTDWCDFIELDGGCYKKKVVDMCLIKRYLPIQGTSYITGIEVLEVQVMKKVVPASDILRLIHIVPNFEAGKDVNTGYYNAYLLNYDANSHWMIIITFMLLLIHRISDNIYKKKCGYVNML